MAEVIGTVAAVSQLGENAIHLIQRLCKAYERFKEQKELFEKLEQDALHIKKIVKIVKKEVALQTDGVNTMLIKLKSSESTLIKWLERVDSGEKGSVRQFAHQLVNGSKERKDLAGIMNELSRVKADLCMNIQVAHVGVTQTVGNVVFANSKVVDRIDRRLRRAVGRGGGLKLAQLQNDGSVQLSQADIALPDSEDSNSTDGSDSELAAIMAAQSSTVLTPRSSTATTARSSRTTTAKSSATNSAGSSRTTTARSSPTKERIVLENTAEKRAIMINAPIGDDLWKDIDRIQIKGNNAKEESVMINHQISRDNFNNVADRQERRMQSGALRD